MKILIVSQYYYPEPFRITDIAETLVKEGHDVSVLTGLPMYPKGYILSDYKKGHKRVETHNGVKIYRVNEIERRNDSFHRFLNYYSFPLFANKHISKLDKDFDVVFINGLSPIMAAYPGLKYAKKYNKKVVMYEMDLWPESLLAGGIKKDSFIYNYFKKVSSKIYSKCDKILVSTKEHIDYIKNLPNCSSLDISYLPQYAEEQFERIGTKEIGETINLMFAGNIGKAQAVDNLIRTANILKDDKRFIFHIVGDGSEYDNCVKLAKEFKLDNVIFYGSKKVEDMPKYYELADIMLISLKDNSFANITVPGKVQSYLAAAKPIFGLSSGATNSLINNSKVGKCFKASEFELLANTLKDISKEELITFSNNSKSLYKKSFKKDIFINTLIKALKD